MPENIIDIPELNPIKYYKVGRTQQANWLTRYMDDYPFLNQIKNYEQPVDYKQPWMRSDEIRQQFSTNYGPITVTIMDCTDNPVLINTAGPATTSILSQPSTFYQSFISLSALPVGAYYFQLSAGVDVEQTFYNSEPIQVEEIIENSIYLQYSHDENDYDVAFDTGIVFNLRVKGGISEPGFGNKSKVYDDQNVNPVRLSSYPYRTQKLVIGGPEGVPLWVADKVNMIFGLDTVLIDGKQYVRPEGANMEPKREDDYPMAGWSFEVREAKNKRSVRFTSPQDGGRFSSVVYNIKSKLFGDMSGPFSNSEVQIIEVE